MYTEEDHKKLFKRFFGNDTKIYKYQSSIYYMKKNDGHFLWDENDDCITMKYDGVEPYTTFMKTLYGKDVRVCFHTGIESVKLIHYHVPSSYEEMCIICDLNGI